VCFTEVSWGGTRGKIGITFERIRTKVESRSGSWGESGNWTACLLRIVQPSDEVREIESQDKAKNSGTEEGSAAIVKMGGGGDCPGGKKKLATSGYSSRELRERENSDFDSWRGEAAWTCVPRHRQTIKKKREEVPEFLSCAHTVEVLGFAKKKGKSPWRIKSDRSGTVSLPKHR